MTGVARLFFILAIAYAILGMLLGLHMAIGQDHTQMPTHAHTMVLGWLMSAVFAFFYHLFPDIGRTPCQGPFSADCGFGHRSACHALHVHGGKSGD